MSDENQQDNQNLNKFAFLNPIERFGSQIVTLTNPDDDIYKFELYLRRLRIDGNGNLIKISKIIKTKFTKYVESDNILMLISENDDYEMKLEPNNNMIDYIKQNKYIMLDVEQWTPMLNEQGINDILMAMQSIVNSMTPLSNLEDWEIAVIIRTLAFDIIDLLTFKSVEYNINDTDRKALVGSALRFSYIFLKRPYQEGDRKFFTKITQEVKHTQEIKQSKSGGTILNPLNWMKGGT